MSKAPPILSLLLVAMLTLSLGCARKRTDAKISSDIQNKFSQDSGLSSKRLTAQASNGVVTLEGLVDNDAQRQAASRQAAAVEGVKEIVNNIQVGGVSSVSPSAGAEEIVASDTRQTRSKATEKKTHKREPDHIYNVQDPAPENDSPNGTVARTSEPPTSDAPIAAAADAPSQASPPPAPAPPQKVTVEQGTQMSVRLIDSIDSEKNQVGDTFHATLNTPLSAGRTEAIPAGTDVTGHIVDVKSSGKFAGQSLLVLQLDSIKSNRQSYALQTDQYRKEGSSRGKSTAKKVGGGAIIGGIIGAIAGGGKGAAIGSAAGAGVGGGAQAASKRQPIKLPSETVLNFTLQAPVVVTMPQDPNAGRQKLGESQ